ncbi:MAG: Hsp70 family protein [Myxococcales bacterium]|nr:Hsp70 family protein [Myxococcales bacterium]
MAMSSWAMDLGTTNTGLARWDKESQRVELVELPDICRKPGSDDPLEAPKLIPSATTMLEPGGFWDRMGRRAFWAKRVFWGKHAIIGRPSLEDNAANPSLAYAHAFKPYLGREPLRPLCRTPARVHTARDVAKAFLRELFANVKSHTGERIRSLVVTTPVQAFESYRAEVSRIGRQLGVSKLRFLDEPVAAAIGYGLSLRNERLVLVVDFGGGTLDLALVHISAKDLQAGTCRVVAKEGRRMGGNDVDRWILDAVCEERGYPLKEDDANEAAAFWYRLMLQEACRVKEAVYFNDAAQFDLHPPEYMRSFEARLRGDDDLIEVTRDRLVEILKERNMYSVLSECVDGLRKQCQREGIAMSDIDDVLMVGGSTLLPGVYPMFEQEFGRDMVRAWQPFEAVAYGAGAFSSGNYINSDFIVHDYAFVTYDAKSHEPQYTVIIPKGTRFPTQHDLWVRKLVPTCSLGEPESIFKLVICEVGQSHGSDQFFTWDAQGNVHKLGGKDAADTAIVVPLNESNPTLGNLKPPHQPDDRRPRLEIAFGVNGERWLIATVKDLKTNKLLMDQQSVVRLL